MTSYSTYGVGRIRYVDGGLSTDEETADEQLEQIKDCLTAGVIRALLDQARDVSDDEQEIDATQWHSPAEGWEVEAVTRDDLPIVRSVVDQLVTAHLADVITLAEFIAWGSYTSGETFRGDSGMGMYRVGYLLGMEGAGQGVGFTDYSYPPVGDIPERLSAWLDTVEVEGRYGKGYPFEGAYVDGTEEPCLLHINS